MHRYEEFREHFLGYNILDCTIENKTMFFFVAKEDQAYLVEQGEMDELSEDELYDILNDDYPPKRVIKVTIAEPPIIQHISLHNFNSAGICCGMSFESIARAIVMDIESHAWVNKSVGNGIEAPILAIREGGLRRGAITRVRSFGGFAICCTNGRDLLIRRGIEHWERLGPMLKKSDGENGFEDFDAFNLDDIYAGGGKGDLWHFNGQQWKQIDLPTNMEISAVCCAGDSFVYVGFDGGTVYKGRNDNWQLIHTDELNLPFKDMVWHEGKVWCTSDFGLWTIENDILDLADVPSSVLICSGNLSMYDDVLLVAGYKGAAYHHQGKWKVLFHAHELDGS